MSEKTTYNQVTEQQSSAYMNRSGDQPTVLVKRTDGRVTVGRLDMDTRDVSFTENGQELVKPNVSMEALSDEGQAQLARELAGVALRGDISPAAPEADLEQDSTSLEGNIGIVMAERGYRDALAEKKRAQQEGRGEDSIYWGQVAGQHYQELQKLRETN